MKRKFEKTKILLLSCIFIGCGGSDLDEVSDGGAVTSTGAQSAIYLDHSPDLSDDGTKVVFISQRAETEASSTSKIYTYDTSLAEAERLSRLNSSDDFGEELLAAVSPDGTLVAFISKDTSGVYHLYVRNWAGTLVAEVTAPSDLIRYDEIEFSPDSQGISYVATVASEGQNSSSLYFVKISVSTQISLDQVNISSNEINPRIVVDGSNTYLISKLQSSSGVVKFKTYLMNLSGTPAATLQKTSGDLSGVGVPVTVDSSGIYFLQDLASPRTKERRGDLAAADDGTSNRNYAVIREGISEQALVDGKSPVSFSSNLLGSFEPVKTNGIQAIEDNIFGVLGGDYYICNNGDSFVSTVAIYNAATNVTVPITVVTNSETAVPESIKIDSCSHMVQGSSSLLQPFERRINRVKIKGSLISGYSMVFESWDSGDGEIYLASFKLTSMASGDDSVLLDTNVETSSILSVSSNSSAAQ